MYVYVLCKYIVHFLGNKHKKEALKLAQLTFHQRMFEFQFLKTGTFFTFFFQQIMYYRYRKNTSNHMSLFESTNNVKMYKYAVSKNSRVKKPKINL